MLVVSGDHWPPQLVKSWPCLTSFYDFMKIIEHHWVWHDIFISKATHHISSLIANCWEGTQRSLYTVQLRSQDLPYWGWCGPVSPHPHNPCKSQNYHPKCLLAPSYLRKNKSVTSHQSPVTSSRPGSCHQHCTQGWRGQQPNNILFKAWKMDFI